MKNRQIMPVQAVFQNRADCLLFVKAGNDAEVQEFLRGL